MSLLSSSFSLISRFLLVSHFPRGRNIDHPFLNFSMILNPMLTFATQVNQDASLHPSYYASEGRRTLDKPRQLKELDKNVENYCTCLKLANRSESLES